MNRFASMTLLATALGCGGTPDASDAGTDAAAPDAARAIDGGHDAGGNAGSDAGNDAFVSCDGVTCTSDACHTAGTCDPSTGTCSHPAVTDGTICSLATSSGVCIGGACLPGCADGHRDGSESDIDCGGTVCATCGVGGACNVDGDCTTDVCSAAHRCAAASCTDARRDGMETDTDCGGGGACPTCAIGATCALDADCASNACSATSLTCVASQCTDARRDGVETDADCGGGGPCPPCAVGRVCRMSPDCASNACSAISLTCVADPCADARRDGDETDIDCGGGTCAACTVARECLTNGDCTTHACDAVSLFCVTNQCADHRVDGAESDVDCGGGTCATCAVGKHCTMSVDCQAGHTCSTSGLCA